MKEIKAEGVCQAGLIRDLWREWENLKPNKDKNNKCGDCVWLNTEDKSSVGYACICPERPFLKGSSSVAYRKQKSTKGCKRWEKR